MSMASALTARFTAPTMLGPLDQDQTPEVPGSSFPVLRKTLASMQQGSSRVLAEIVVLPGRAHATSLASECL
jgi:hypothetical protein